MKVFKRDKKLKKQIRKLGTVKQLKHNELLNTVDLPRRPDHHLFDSFEMNDLIKKSLKVMKYTHATDIQAKILPHALEFKNVVAAEKTGSGKTLAYLIPLLNLVLKFRFKHYNSTAAIVITPTKELCEQICSVFSQLSQFTNIRYGMLHGGTSMKDEVENLMRGCTVLFATPSSLLKHMELSFKRKEDGVDYFRYHNVRILVLDEADRMVIDKDLIAVVEALPQTRQNIVLSATLNFSEHDSLKGINEFCSKVCGDRFVRINVPTDINFLKQYKKPKNATVDKLIEGFVQIKSSERLLFLYSLIKRIKDKKILIFMSTSEEVTFYYKLLNLAYVGDERLLILHSQLSDTLRTSNLLKFNQLDFGCLLCTDVISRGIDISQIDLVVQFDIPTDVTSYVHRVGRTARGGQEGTAIIVLRPFEIEPVLSNLKQISMCLIEFEVPLMETITDFHEYMPEKSDLLALAKKAFRKQISVYQKSKLVENVFDQINLDEEAVNFCLREVPKLQRKLKCNLNQ